MKIFTIIVLLFISCKVEPLKINSISLCEYFTSDGICKEKLEEIHEYKLVLPKQKNFETWESLSNYLYFHSRQTPGFIVRFNRKFSLTEKQNLKNSFKASYEFYGGKGVVEGIEIGEDWIGSFQYLGSILKDRQRKYKQDKSYPYLETIFPSKIFFDFFSDYGNGKIETEVDLKFIRNEN